MIASELINYLIPPLKPSDDVGKAKLWMDELRVNQLPVVEDSLFKGFIKEEMLFDDQLHFALVGDYPLQGQTATIALSDHYLAILKKAGTEATSILAVLDDLGHFQGVVTTLDIVEELAKSSAVAISGAILQLRLRLVDYSLSEISRIVESHEAKIMSSHISNLDLESNSVTLTLKLNKEDISRIVSALEKYGYLVNSSYDASPSGFDEQDRIDQFMRYLKI